MIKMTGCEFVIDQSGLAIRASHVTAVGKLASAIV